MQPLPHVGGVPFLQPPPTDPAQHLPIGDPLAPRLPGLRGGGSGNNGSMRWHIRPTRSAAAAHHTTRPGTVDQCPQRTEDLKIILLGPLRRSRLGIDRNSRKGNHQWPATLLLSPSL